MFVYDLVVKVQNAIRFINSRCGYGEVCIVIENYRFRWFRISTSEPVPKGETTALLERAQERLDEVGLAGKVAVVVDRGVKRLVTEVTEDLSDAATRRAARLYEATTDE